MSADASSASQTRQQRIEEIMEQLRPKIDAAVRQLVERAVDVPEAEEFGAVDFEFRDAGQGFWSTRSGKLVWRAGKKGLRRVERNVPLLRLRGQVSLVSTTAVVDGSWGSDGSASLLLLRPVSAEFPPLRRGVGTNR
jgi:hypothetical protein